MAPALGYYYLFGHPGGSRDAPTPFPLLVGLASRRGSLVVDFGPKSTISGPACEASPLAAKAALQRADGEQLAVPFDDIECKRAEVRPCRRHVERHRSRARGHRRQLQVAAAVRLEQCVLSHQSQTSISGLLELRPELSVLPSEPIGLECRGVPVRSASRT